MSNEGEIYMITNLVNGKQYIGQTLCYYGEKWKNGTERRWRKHISNANLSKNFSVLLERAIRKYGEESFEIEIICICDREYLNFHETDLIKEFKTLKPFGYNLMEGGGAGIKMSPETRDKIRMSSLGKTHTEETKEKIRNSQLQREITLNKRNRMCDENKKKLNLALKKLNMDMLPSYVYMGIDHRINAEKIEVKVPGKKMKKFGRKNMELTEKIKLAIEYRNSII